MNTKALLHTCGALLLVLAALVWMGPLAAQTVAPAPLPNPDLQLLTNGTVRAIAHQSDGGIVFGGYFSSVNGIPRRNIARLLPDGTLDPVWNPSANGAVHALAMGSNGAVYAGGSFNSIGGQPRSHIARLAGSGAGAADTSWNPSADSDVYALAVDGVAVYAGGWFSSIGGQSRSYIAKLSGSGTGTADTSWNPSADSAVSALVVDGGAVYAGGWFSSIGGQSRSHIAKLSGSGTGTADASWNPSANSAVSALAVDGGAVYAGGWFSSIGGQSRSHIAKLSGGGGGDADPNWNPSANFSVRALVVDNSGAVYAAGTFSHIGGQPRSCIAKLSGSGTGVADAGWNPSANSGVYALALNNNGALYAGGDFSNIGGQQRLAFAAITSGGDVDVPVDAESPGMVRAIATQPDGGKIISGKFLKAGDQSRRNLLRLKFSGALDPDWNPSPDRDVFALAVDSLGAVYAGGSFSSIGGQQRFGIAKLAGSGTGAANANWNPSASGTVEALAVDSSGAVYAGGHFSNIGGQPRSFIAKLSGSGTGAADALWDPSANNVVRALAVGSDGAVYAGGWFHSIGGEARDFIAKLSGSGTGAADTNWNPSASYFVDALAVASDGAVFAGGQFNSIGGEWRNYIAKLSGSGTGAADASWNPSADNYVQALAVDSDGAVYAGGGFHSIGGEWRNYIAKLSGSGTGAADASWNPSADNYVQALAVDSSGAVYAGGSFTSIGGQPRVGIAALPSVVRWTLTYTADANGTISGLSPQTIEHGADGEPVTAVPNTGYHFVQWSDGVLTPLRTDTNVTSNINVSASFAITTFTVTTTAVGNGNITPPSQSVAPGAAASFAVTPAVNHHLVSVTGDTCTPTQDSGNNWSAGNIIADCAVTATFAIDSYTVTAAAGANGAITPSTQAVDHGDTASFTVTPDPGYTASVGGSCGGTLVGATYTTNAITADCTVSATFAQLTVLTIEKTVDRAEAEIGDGLTWTVVVSNTGPDTADAELLDAMPNDVEGVQWTCVASNGASCGQGSGSGDIDFTSTLPVGGTITVTISATVSASAPISQMLVNDAAVNWVSEGRALSATDSASTFVVAPCMIFCDDFENPSAPRPTQTLASLAGRVSLTPSGLAQHPTPVGKPIAVRRVGRRAL